MYCPMIRGPRGTLLGVWHWQPLAWWIGVASVVHSSWAVPSIRSVAVRAVGCVRSGSGSAFSPRHTRPLRFRCLLCDGGLTHRCSNANSRSDVFAGQIDRPLNSSTGLGIWHALHSSKESYLKAWDVRLANAWLTTPLLVAVRIKFPGQSYSQML
jgi:hypothetical protein